MLPDDVRWRRVRWVRLGPDFLAALIASRRAWMLDTLEETAGDLAPFVGPAALERARAAFEGSGTPSAGEMLWQAAMLGKWLHAVRSRVGYDSTAAEVTGGGGVGNP